MPISSQRIGHRPRLLIGAVAAVALILLGVFAAAAEALPANFWGAVPQTSLSSEQLERVHRGGVASERVIFDWSTVQPTRGGPFDFGTLDSVVENAAKAGVNVLPFLDGAPTWADPTATVPGSGGAKTSSKLPVSGIAKSGWAAYLTAVVGRYGPKGSFWAEHPLVPKQPIRFWQIWNEPNFEYFVAKPNPTEYGQLVAQSYTALKAADPGSRVVLAGLFGRPKGSETSAGKHKSASLNWSAANFLESMYKTVPNIRTKFSGVALHPYSYYFQELAPEIEKIRQVLVANHDGAKGLWITEIGWSSEKPTSTNLFAKGEAGQAQQMKGAFNLFKQKQVPWKIQRVYWFSIDDLQGACNFCGGSGLFSEGFKPKKAWTTYAKFAGGTP